MRLSRGQRASASPRRIPGWTPNASAASDTSPIFCTPPGSGARAAGLFSSSARSPAATVSSNRGRRTQTITSEHMFAQREDAIPIGPPGVGHPRALSSFHDHQRKTSKPARQARPDHRSGARYRRGAGRKAGRARRTARSRRTRARQARRRREPLRRGHVRRRRRCLRQPQVTSAINGAAEKLGGLDVVVANAGIATGGPLRSQDLRSWERVIEINLLGVMYTDRAALPHLEKSRGYLLNVASAAAVSHGPGMSAYCAAKAGVEALSNSLRIE